MKMAPSRADRLAAACGLVGVLGNVLGVVALAEVPGAYRAGELDVWAGAALAHPAASVASAVAFAIGVLALGGWAVGLAQRVSSQAAWAGGCAIAAGALLNAVGALAPLVLTLHVAPGCGPADACAVVGRALLGFGVALDALFNLLLGVGLLALGGALRHAAFPRALAWLATAAGAASLPVSLQVGSDAAARWLVVAGPLWLLFVSASSVLLWRPRRLATRAAEGR